MGRANSPQSSQSTIIISLTEIFITFIIIFITVNIINDRLKITTFFILWQDDYLRYIGGHLYIAHNITK